MKRLRNTLYLLAAASVLVSLAIGCSKQGTPATPTPTSSTTTDWKSGLDQALIEGLSQLEEADRTAALALKTCPVSGKALGEMGKPLKVTVEGRDVFLCCPGCEEKLRANPQEYFSKLDKS